MTRRRARARFLAGYAVMALVAGGVGVGMILAMTSDSVPVEVGAVAALFGWCGWGTRWAADFLVYRWGPSTWPRE